MHIVETGNNLLVNYTPLNNIKQQDHFPKSGLFSCIYTIFPNIILQNLFTKSFIYGII